MIVLTRTPFRVSFFGGGTDVPEFFRQHGGAVLGTAIDRYCHLAVFDLPDCFDYRIRVAYSKVELARTPEEINHPLVRACLAHYGITGGLEIAHFADLPARTGLGTSSSFAVGLLLALGGRSGGGMTAEGLAADAVRIEREVLQEAGGWQDQYFAAYGGLQRFDFGPDGSVRLTRVETGPGVMAGLESSMRMYFTGMIRDSAEVMLARAAESPSHTPAMLRILDLVDEAEKLLRNRWDATAFGRLLDEAWRLKRTLSAAVSSPRIDELYETACRAGATGGKLLGAGGGGFLLLCVPPERQGDVAAALPGLYEVPLRSSLDGATVVYQAAT